MSSEQVITELGALLAEYRAQRDKLGASLRRIEAGYRTIDKEKHTALLTQYVALSTRCETLRISHACLSLLWNIPTSDK